MFEDMNLREYELAKGGKLTIYRPAQGSLLKIKTDGGQLHPSLQGSFTEIKFAEQAIHRYLDNHYKTPRTSKNVENKVEEKQKQGKDLEVNDA